MASACRSASKPRQQPSFESMPALISLSATLRGPAASARQPRQCPSRLRQSLQAACTGFDECAGSILGGNVGGRLLNCLCSGATAGCSRKSPALGWACKAARRGGEARGPSRRLVQVRGPAGRRGQLQGGKEDVFHGGRCTMSFLHKPEDLPIRARVLRQTPHTSPVSSELRGRSRHLREVQVRAYVQCRSAVASEMLLACGVGHRHPRKESQLHELHA